MKTKQNKPGAFFREIMARHGFVSNQDDLSFVKLVNGIIQGILFVGARSSKTEYSVLCSVCKMGETEVAEEFPGSKRCVSNLLMSEVKFFLSPTAPFQNSYNWDFFLG